MAVIFAAREPKEGSFAVLPKGEYSFEILNAEEKVMDKDGASLKKGTQLFELKLRFDGPNDTTATVFDRLYFAEKTFWKVDHLLKSIGKHPGAGENVELDAFDLCGERGTARLKVGKTQGGQDRNEVDAYTWEA